MRRLCLLVCALGFTGCLSPQTRTTDWLDKYNPFTPPTAAPKAVLRTVLLDRPAGDPYLTRELWTDAYKPLAPEAAALLAENGLRVGTFAGNTPAKFLAMLKEDSTVTPTESVVPVGEAKIVPVNGPLAETKFGLLDSIGGDPHPFALTAAECGLAVTATPADGGKVKLSIEPRVQHGAKQGWLRPTADLTGLTWRDGKAAERFGKLTVELTVGPGEYVFVGPSESPAGKLGGAFFFPPSGPGGGRMRVFVVRAWKPADGPAPGGGTIAAQAAGR